jgi:phenylacetate-CoA ligase
MISLFEKYMKISGYDIHAAIEKISEIQSLSLDEFQHWQDKQKWSIAKYHYANNPFYRKKVGNRFPDRWEELPLMKKSDYQDDIENLLSKGYTKKNTYISNTSGSSGHPFFFAKNKEAHAMDWALIKNRYGWHGLSINSKQARFYGIPLEIISYFKEKIKDRLMNRVRFSVFDLSDVKLKEFLDLFKKQHFEFIYGYTNSIVLFARYLTRSNVVLKNECPKLKLCITTSEVLTYEDRNILSNAFGVNVINEYGASEIGLLAFESLLNEWLLSEEILFFEVLDSYNDLVSDDREGNIVVTDLDNKAMPFIRYNIGDIGIISKKLSVNSKYRKLEKLLGRENDNIVLPSGKTAPGLTFYYISRSLLESTGILREFTIRQVKKNEFIFDIVTDRDLTKNEIKNIKLKMEKYLEPGLRININRLPKIKRPPSGKIKHFYSEIKT